MEQLSDANSYESGNEVAADECSWLREGRFDRTVAENSRGTLKNELDEIGLFASPFFLRDETDITSDDAWHVSIDEVICVTKDSLAGPVQLFRTKG